MAKIDCNIQKNGNCGKCVWGDICEPLNKLSRNVNHESRPGKKIKVKDYGNRIKIKDSQNYIDTIKELKNLY